jgi:P-type E1-E2 ATPase
VLPGAGLDEREVLALAAAAENPSEHPLGRAVVTAARDAGLTVGQATEFSALPGRGITALVAGHRVEIGSPAHLSGPVNADVDAMVAGLESDGQTAAVMMIDGQPAAVLGIADRIRPSAAATVARITAVTGTAPVLLTGDNHRAAVRLAAQAGISDVRASLLPQDKVDAVRELEARGWHVLLAGDGVNDAPALAAGDLGIAMGAAGSEVAIHSATIALMNNDLRRLPFLVRLSRQTRAVINQNFLIGIVFVIGGLILAALKFIDPIVAAILHVVGSLLVVFNSARLVRQGEEFEPHLATAPPEPPKPPPARLAAVPVNA